VAVVAEPDEPSRYAEVVLANLGAGGFRSGHFGQRKEALAVRIGGHDVRLGEFEVVPDLAIICASLDLVPSIIEQLGARGTRA
jgi:acetyltransferase